MNSENRIPRFLGAVFLIQAVGSLSSSLLFDATVGSGSISDSLVSISNKPLQMQMSILVEMITCLGIVALGVLLFVVLQKQNKNIALVALGWYMAEATILAVSRINSFSLLSLSKEYVEAGSPDSSYFQTLGSLLCGADRSGDLIHMLFFSLGGILFYYLFYRSRYIPRVLSAWGLIAVSLAFIATLLGFFDIDLFLIALPNLPFEITVGIWLMVKGINYSKT